MGKAFMQYCLNKGSGFINRIIVPAVMYLGRVQPGSWGERQVKVMADTLYWIPANLLLGHQVDNAQVEAMYNQVSGSYIKHQVHKGYQAWSIVDGKLVKASTLELKRLFLEEFCQVFDRYPAASVLEVGAGELTTLFPLASHLGLEDKRYAGIDLSLNRLYHGRHEFVEGHGLKVTLAQADAGHLPFADNSFDLVYTAHCLELMPWDNHLRTLSEMCRVARQRVLLFEPCWELGGWQQRLRMRRTRYVRGLPAKIAQVSGARLKESFLLKSHVNPFNKTGCYNIVLEKDISEPAPAEVLACPLCHGPLENGSGHYRCRPCSRVYFIFEGIPLLDQRHSLYVTQPVDWPETGPAPASN